jgi:hypothetical protein
MTIKTFLSEDIDVIRPKFGKTRKGRKCEWKRFENLNYFEDSGKAEQASEW